MVNWRLLSIIMPFIGFSALYMIWRNPGGTYNLKCTQSLVLGSYFLILLLYLELKEEMGRLDVSPVDKGGSRLLKGCFNFELVPGSTREENGVCKIVVECKAAMLTEGGCPTNCPKFRRPTPSGSGVFGGLIGGAILGEIIAPYGGGIPGAIIGALFGIGVEDSAIKSQLQRKEEECKSQGKGVIIRYVPSTR